MEIPHTASFTSSAKRHFPSQMCPAVAFKNSADTSPIPASFLITSRMKSCLLSVVFLCTAWPQLGLAETTAIEPPAVVLPAEIHDIAPDQVERQLVDHLDTLVIDVRTEDERRTRGFILNSLHHDYFHTQTTLDALAKLDKTKPCIVYCAIGGRAKRIAVEMHRLGFKNILLLKGGFNAWTASGQAVAK